MLTPLAPIISEVYRGRNCQRRFLRLIAQSIMSMMKIERYQSICGVTEAIVLLQLLFDEFDEFESHTMSKTHFSQSVNQPVVQIIIVF